MDHPERQVRPDDFDALAPETFGSAYEVYRELRQKCPVAYSNAYGGYWTLTRYDDVVAAVTNPGAFTTVHQNVVPSMALSVRRPPFAKDPPEHTPYRRALDRTLRPERIEALEPALRAHATRELERMIAAGGGDMSQDFATIYPAWIAAEWLDLPGEWVDDLADVGRLYNVAWRGMDVAAVKATSERLYGFARALVADRQRRPRIPERDPTTALLNERHDGKPIEEEYVVATIRQVLVVGLMAPPPLFGSIVVHLSEHRDLQDRLRREPELIPAATEEFLRLYSPYRGFARTAVRPITLHGRTIEQGDAVAMSYSSANRDETVFEDPDVFKLGRRNISRHVAFGRGPHHCAGSQLVRMELRIALEELLSRTSAIEVRGPVEMTQMPELGPVSTPVDLRR